MTEDKPEVCHYTMWAMKDFNNYADDMIERVRAGALSEDDAMREIISEFYRRFELYYGGSFLHGGRMQ